MKDNVIKSTIMALALASSLLLSLSNYAMAQNTDLIRTDDTLSLPLYKSGILSLDKTPSQISVGNPGIADILVLRGTQVHVIAKALGSTNVVFWDRNGSIFATVDIEVTHDLDSLKKKLFALLPNEKIGVFSAQEKLILNGTVSGSAKLQAALDIADSFLPECIAASSSATSDASGKLTQSNDKITNAESCKKAEIVNMMTVGGSQQIMLEVKVAEISRRFLRNLDSDLTAGQIGTNENFGAVTGGATWPNVLINGNEVPFVPGGVADGLSNPIGPMVDALTPNVPSIGDTGIFFSSLIGDSYYQLAMEISQQKGLSKILAEPNLTTLTGRQAKFVAGGEFPITVITADGVEVIYKEFGVLVDFTPTILDDQRISLDLDIGVSELRADSAVLGTEALASAGGFPIIDKRGASSTVELRNGQTIGIAGLLQDDLVENFSRMPGLGDIPILGHLFRSQGFLSEQTELVIFVTPHLAKPIAPELVKFPTDSFVPPNDFEFYVLGSMASLKKPKPVSRRRAIDGGFDSVSFGHKL